MRAEIVSVGTELLLGQIVDTNAAYLSKLLPEFGITLHYRVTVGDNEARLAEALRLALSRSDLVFTIGGLGPTEDDLTKETVAQVVGDEMVLDEESARQLREFFAARGIEMPKSNLKQAMVPGRGRKLPNPLGTAPGAAFETQDGKVIIVLPGPPREFIPMVNERVAPYLRERLGTRSGIIKSRILRVAGLGESSVEDKVKHLLKNANPTLAPYAKTGEVHLRVTAKAATISEADALIDSMDREVVGVLGDHVFGRDEETLEEVVVKSLVEHGLTLSLAESCTGGLIANRITDIPGSSDAFLMGVVSYSNQAKMDLLGVDEQLLIDHGAVSEEVARAMAEGARMRAGSDIAVSVTGIAGPTGATPTKPVGLVYVALSAENGTVVQKCQFGGSRLDVKLRTSQTALDMIRMHLIHNAT
ncbi:MAG: competence/damage-inducible protein A [Armatimonadota bacterium]|nr:competence/damage-inducible protein A [bacterium]